MKLTRAGFNDIPTIHSLAERIWKSYYPSIISREQIDYMLGKMYSPIALESQMKEGQDFYLLQSGDEVCGYLSVSATNGGDYFLHKFYMENGRHRQGFGSLFFNELLKLIPSTASLRLTVNRQNFKAINFYFKNGFIIERVADFDIGDGFEMNDFVMVRQPLQPV